MTNWWPIKLRSEPCLKITLLILSDRDESKVIPEVAHGKASDPLGAGKPTLIGARQALRYLGGGSNAHPPVGELPERHPVSLVRDDKHLATFFEPHFA